MIHNEAEFEAALDEATRLLEQPADLSEVSEARLGEVLAAIQSYRPASERHPEDPLRDRVTALAGRLDAFQQERALGKPPAGSHWPITGVFPG